MKNTQNSPKQRQEKQRFARRKHWNHMQVTDWPRPDAPSLTQTIIVQMVYSDTMNANDERKSTSSRKKLLVLSRSLFQHVQTLCMPSFIDLHTHATAGHVTSFACTKLQSKHFRRSLAWSHHTKDLRDRGETWNTSGQPRAVAWLHQLIHWHAVGEVIYLAIVLDGHQPVMTGHNARWPRTGRERGSDGGPLKLLTWPFGRWTIDSSLP